MKGKVLILAVAIAASSALLAGPSRAGESGESFRVGSKKFTESVVLGELLAHLARDQGFPVEHLRELGGTRILFNALLAGELDAYPEYTGTISHEILGNPLLVTEVQIRAELAKQGVLMSRPLGFNNTYALGMKEERASALGIVTISDLAAHSELRFGFTNEFMDRGDGWPGLKQRYGLPQGDVRGLDHDLAYRGLESDSLDVMDLYSTDAEIQYHGLRVLEDDLAYFPRYDAVLLIRESLKSSRQGLLQAWLRLEGRIDEGAMVALNARAKIDRVPEAVVASEFLAVELGTQAEAEVEGAVAAMWRRLKEHLRLVFTSLVLAIVLAIPLGVVAAKKARVGQLILSLVGVVQTVPTLALLVFMIPLLGQIGELPAMLALFLYSLLPIVRGTHAGIVGIPAELSESALALGLPARARLRLVELPLATRSILSGIKTAAVINVGTATLGALIGAGGFGQPILTGIRLDDTSLILQGAIPAALLALLVQGAFDLAERWWLPRGLRSAA